MEGSARTGFQEIVALSELAPQDLQPTSGGLPRYLTDQSAVRRASKASAPGGKVQTTPQLDVPTKLGSATAPDSGKYVKGVLTGDSNQNPKEVVYPAWQGNLQASEIALSATALCPKDLFDEVSGVLVEEMPSEVHEACKVQGKIKVTVFVDLDPVLVHAQVFRAHWEHEPGSVVVLRDVARSDVVRFQHLVQHLLRSLRGRDGTAARSPPESPHGPRLLDTSLGLDEGMDFDDSDLEEEAWPASAGVEHQRAMIEPLVKALYSKTGQQAVDASVAVAQISSRAPSSWKAAVAAALLEQPLALTNVFGAPPEFAQLPLQYPLAVALTALSENGAGITSVAAQRLQVILAEHTLQAVGMPVLIETMLSSAAKALEHSVAPEAKMMDMGLGA